MSIRKVDLVLDKFYRIRSKGNMEKLTDGFKVMTGHTSPWKQTYKNLSASYAI